MQPKAAEYCLIMWKKKTGERNFLLIKSIPIQTVCKFQPSRDDRKLCSFIVSKYSIYSQKLTKLKQVFLCGITGCFTGLEPYTIVFSLVSSTYLCKFSSLY